MQEDYFMRQIDQLGKALAKVLSDLLNLRKSGNTTASIGIIENLFQNELNIDLKIMAEIDKEDFISHLINELKVSESNFENLSNVLVYYAESVEEAKDYYEKALILLEYVQLNSPDFSFSRKERIGFIKSKVYL